MAVTRSWGTFRGYDPVLIFMGDGTDEVLTPISAGYRGAVFA